MNWIVECIYLFKNIFIIKSLRVDLQATKCFLENVAQINMYACAIVDHAFFYAILKSMKQCSTGLWYITVPQLDRVQNIAKISFGRDSNPGS